MEIAIISGKGGTGKSSVCAAFATLCEKAVLVDCDVEAANMHTLFNPEIETEEVYVGAQTAVIDEHLCTNCGVCFTHCRFDAIKWVHQRVVIEEVFCDGCRLCERVCPQRAIRMVKSDQSRLYTGKYRFGDMVFGILGPGEENSGKLVNRVREKAKEVARSKQLETILMDGPPGIGCPAISTITGVDRVVVVTEPTLSGLHDLERSIQIIANFSLSVQVIINKYDINQAISAEIEAYCDREDIEIVAKLPFDKRFVEAMVACKSIIEFANDSAITSQISAAFHHVMHHGT
ncbi:MAG: (4Fe-4S)-binding protein [Bacteroidetes bacterium]|nr:MAG: (4Fe-4S)-binding protein [Bacteroidota bacterium]